MAKQTINTGTTPADHTGDSVRTAFNKVNANFSELYEAAGNAVSADELEEHVNDINNPHGVTKSQVGLPNVDNTSDAEKPVSNATQTALNAKATTTALDAETAARIAADATNASAIAAETAARTAADALKADLVGGVIPTAQIPAIAITTFLGSVASQAAMLGLSGQSGDWCNCSDTSTAWVIIGAEPTQLSSWAQINYPASPVTSVNGQSGVIVLGKADVGLGSVDNTPDSGKPVSTVQQSALNAKQDKSSLGADSAAAVHAATSKTTPVDNDEIGVADSAASFGLKRFTWANIKAALKTYFDTLYNNYVLPAPGTTTLGGVKRNAGSAGEFVNGIDSNGALTYGTPAGVGGGANGMAGFAFIHSVTGNDATAVLGDPTKPYQTAGAGVVASQALLGTGKAQLYIQNDCSADSSLTLTSPLDLLLYGDRSDSSILGAIYFDGPNSGVSTITGNGRSRVRLVGLYINGIDGAAGTPGAGDGAAGGSAGDGQAAQPFVVRAITCHNAASVGGAGGVGGDGAYGGETNNNGGNGGLGGIGGRGGDITFYDCNLAPNMITSLGGDGGNGGSGGGGYTGEFGTGSAGSGGSGGNPGNGGDLSFYNCSADAGGPAVSCAAGAVGYGEGGAGIPGGNGQLTLSWSEIGSYANVAGGTIRMSFHTSTFVDNGAA